MASPSSSLLGSVCWVCSALFHRDDFTIVERDGIWTCQSNDPRIENDCGFSMPIGTTRDEMIRLALEHIAKLKSEDVDSAENESTI